MLVFAAAQTEPTVLAYPWWVTNALVPAGIAILGSLLTLVASWLLARQTDLYRRLSRWEPYSEQLRERQIELYSEICSVARKTMIATGAHALYAKPEEKVGGPYIQEMLRAIAELEKLMVVSSILLSSHFNQVCNDYFHQFDNYAKLSVPPESHAEFLLNFEKTQNKFVSLVNAARKSIGTDPLDEKAKKAIREGLSKENTINT